MPSSTQEKRLAAAEKMPKFLRFASGVDYKGSSGSKKKVGSDSAAGQLPGIIKYAAGVETVREGHGSGSHRHRQKYHRTHSSSHRRSSHRHSHGSSNGSSSSHTVSCEVCRTRMLCTLWELGPSECPRLAHCYACRGRAGNNLPPLDAQCQHCRKFFHLACADGILHAAEGEGKPPSCPHCDWKWEKQICEIAHVAGDACPEGTRCAICKGKAGPNLPPLDAQCQSCEAFFHYKCVGLYLQAEARDGFKPECRHCGWQLSNVPEEGAPAPGSLRIV
ncbi:hypothetical protein BO70DRAFT_395205 [Aspergillus heteromorphus CBS 117.55]|uniref:Zinc finger PHD-type domain-containing protein n=1 Tax=Aspergillus heteromorphus CBS 117.55 TaxID=1448321 RepID=A0A317WIF3_9EURO|nr:uncharacterized protein BO70DRAFT_395205 [Aspergillus heteromorphus CBS 117.55]PWY86079.1 hypothetical protein BO70DRAFT_395205 [Aspergillus heteromorphus CBS 117.55]